MWLFQLACLGWPIVCALVLYSFSKIASLSAFDPIAAEAAPTISIVVAARDEVETIGRAVATLLDLSYPNLEIIVVDDRSTDGTGEILDALRGRLKVVHISRLPEGWLGKTHALHRGAEVATGEWLLFTDADIHFSPTSLSRAATAAASLELDHLTCAPRIVTLTFWENIFTPFFGLAFGLKYRPDLVSSPDPRYFAGIGAFQLIRSEVYRSLGGHSLLRMLVLDDMELGHLVKLRGYRQGVLEAAEHLSVRWTVGLRGIVHGLEKNAYAGFDYNFGKTFLGALIVTVAALAPVVVALGGGPLWLPLMAIGSVSGLSFLLARGVGGGFWSGCCLPLTGPLLALVSLRSAVLAEWRRGIYWRKNFYSLPELRRHRLR